MRSAGRPALYFAVDLRFFTSHPVQTFAMPIYAYRCASCGHAKDVLQKLSDDPLTVCPSCGAATFSKQLTAAGFQLKGSGWYVTDFRDGDKGKKDAKPDAVVPPGDKPADASAKPADAATPAAAPAPAATPAPAPAAAAPAAAPPPSAGS
jgi:putative FmdB family regulatory protein